MDFDGATVPGQALDKRSISPASPYDVAHDSLPLFARKDLVKKLCGLQDIFWSCPFAKIFGQVAPAHHAGSVH